MLCCYYVWRLRRRRVVLAGEEGDKDGLAPLGGTCAGATTSIAGQAARQVGGGGASGHHDEEAQKLHQQGPSASRKVSLFTFLWTSSLWLYTIGAFLLCLLLFIRLCDAKRFGGDFWDWKYGHKTASTSSGVTIITPQRIPRIAINAPGYAYPGPEDVPEIYFFFTGWMHTLWGVFVLCYFPHFRAGVLRAVSSCCSCCQRAPGRGKSDTLSSRLSYRTRGASETRSGAVVEVADKDNIEGRMKDGREEHDDDEEVDALLDSRSNQHQKLARRNTTEYLLDTSEDDLSSTIQMFLLAVLELVASTSLIEPVYNFTKRMRESPDYFAGASASHNLAEWGTGVLIALHVGCVISYRVKLSSSCDFGLDLELSRDQIVVVDPSSTSVYYSSINLVYQEQEEQRSLSPTDLAGDVVLEKVTLDVEQGLGQRQLVKDEGILGESRWKDHQHRDSCDSVEPVHQVDENYDPQLAAMVAKVLAVETGCPQQLQVPRYKNTTSNGRQSPCLPVKRYDFSRGLRYSLIATRLLVGLGLQVTAVLYIWKFGSTWMK
ncbi:unnamed protein product [Amoebophrya sp. A25]|nr:unnamed protein product [Amoebophrya sp. A25]|eukprot:GSA25T00017346001.1